MSNRDDTAPGAPPPLVYQIRVKGLLGPEWVAWFGGLSIAPCANDDTVLTGPLADQAALFGVLKKLRDLGLPLLALSSSEPRGSESE